jgi:hypothetical protein
MVVKKAFGRDLSGSLPGRAPGSSRSRFDDGGGLQYVSRKSDLSLRFFLSRGLYRRRGIVRGGTRRSHHRWARPGARPRPLVVRLAHGSPLSHLWSSRSFDKNRRFGFFLSNSGNISCVTFLKYKNSRKQGTSTVISC